MVVADAQMTRYLVKTLLMMQERSKAMLPVSIRVRRSRRRPPTNQVMVGALRCW